VHRSVLELQEPNTENNDEINNGEESDGEVGPIKKSEDKTGNAPVHKNDKKNKHWDNRNYEQQNIRLAHNF
jgi:hypothetical protein